MRRFAGMVKVSRRSVGIVRPPKGTIWRITALIAKGLDFGIKFGSTVDATGIILVNDYNLSCEVTIDEHNYILFDNRGGKGKVGFFCGEEHT